MTDILDVIGQLVDEQVGIIGQVQDLQRDGAPPSFVYMSARTCNLQVLNPAQHSKGFFLGCGTAPDRSRAMAKAVGEAVEHYCAANYAAADFPLSTFNSASFACVPPEEFALFSPEQYAGEHFPYMPFTRATPVRWVPALNLLTQETKYVPASMVFLPYAQVLDGETSITQQISTGLACHSHPTAAALSAVCEVIERDAIAITWQARLPRPRIRLDSLSPQNLELLSRLKRPGASIVLLYLAMDHGIPVIFSLMHNTTLEAPALLAAAAAHPDPERAVQKSLEELAQLQPISQLIKLEKRRFNPGRKWEHVTDFDSHTNVYNDHANVHHVDFLLNPRTSIAFQEIPNVSVGDLSCDLDCVVQKVAAVKHDVLVVDVTTEDVRSLGLWVLRAMIPGFQPLFIGHHFRALGGTRLWELPQRLGYPGLSRSKGDNPAPHPFA